MKTANAKQTIERALDELIGAVEAGHSERLTTYLAMLARFRRYSWGNVLLILTQCPGASRVAGYRAWQRLGRQVRRGAKAVRIVAPITRKTRSDEEEDKRRVVAFKTACVFDVSQTEGKPLPEFARVHGDPGKHLSRLKKLISDRGITLEYSTGLGGADGLSSGGRIVVRDGLSPAEEFSVLVHELAHETLHQSDSSTREARKIRETEAEAVAFIVCQAVGLDTNSAARDYIQLYQGDRDTLTESFQRIQQTGAEIIEGLEGEKRAKLAAPHTAHAAPVHRSLFEFI